MRETISSQEYTDKPTEIDNCENQLRQSLSKTIKIKEVYFPALFPVTNIRQYPISIHLVQFQAPTR